MSSTTELLDARGVLIEPGDIAIYGFGVSRSVAMAEAIVLAADKVEAPCNCETREYAFREHDTTCPEYPHPSVSVTPKGRVRLRVVRRSYNDGEKPTVDVAPDRLVVLKHGPVPGLPNRLPTLPLSPLPTQDEIARPNIQERIDRYVEHMRSTVSPPYWKGELAGWHAWCAARLAEERAKLKAIND
jgi:hypothetical protein